MSARLPLRPQLAAIGGYRSAQPEAEVRLNANESPAPPPPAFCAELADAVGAASLHRYPDRDAVLLRRGIAALHGVDPSEVFCANGSNEVLLCLLLAFGGADRRALVFEPTYTLHGHIARLTATEVVASGRDEGMRIDPAEAESIIASTRPDVVFVCSPNNPTGRLEDPGVLRRIVAAAPGLVVVDEAYGQFAPWSALELRGEEGSDGLVVVRTFSKTWAMAGVRLGYLVAHEDVVAGCRASALPYHLSTPAQLAGTLALRHDAEMHARVGQVAEGRRQLAASMDRLDVETWPSDANFVLFRPRHHDGADVWKALIADGVLVRDFTAAPGLEGCLRVTVGTSEENERFLESLARVLA